MEAFIQERGKRQMLSRRPVQAFTGRNRIGAAFDNPAKCPVNVYAIRNRGDFLAEFFQFGF